MRSMDVNVGGLLLLTLSSVAAGWVTSAVLWASAALVHLLMLERKYTANRNRPGIDALLAELEATHVFAERRDAHGQRMVPSGAVIGPPGRPYVAFVESKGEEEYRRPTLTVRVLRPRWLGPLLPDAVTSRGSGDPGIRGSMGGAMQNCEAATRS